MKIRLLKKWRVYVIGTTLDVSDPVAKVMLHDGTAEIYTERFSPNNKMKTEFFKPIKRKGNGKGKRK